MFVKEFETIYFEYYDMVFRYVFSLCKEETWAEEITQEAFFKALKNINSFRGECKLSVWLCQIAKNIFYKEAKYIIIGEPYIRPNKSLSEAFYEKLGNYINVLSSDKRILFSVRYSEELLKMLQERCENIEIIKK